MSLTKLLPVILLMMATGVQASTRDEIERLWNPQGMAAQPAQPAADTSARTEKPAPRWFRLSNGRQVNLADWKVVLFMQGHCPYCHQFDPVLKQLAQQYGFSVFPYKAYYWIQANVLKADKMDLRESQGWLNRGYEGAAVGAALGAGITGYNSSSAGATLGVGLAAGLVGMAADAMVEDVNYTMITDVQIAERTKATVTTDNVAALRQGTSGAKIQTSTETGNQHKYQTRVVSNANKVNLKFEEAKPVLEDQLAKSIANIL